jgi:class 3 adenylate cyclase/tetratricopeptide (TPR) repeat protein
MRCARCGADNREGRRFCAECGAGLLPSGCPACGFGNEPGERFCGGCGAPLATAARPDPREPAAASAPAPAAPEAYTPRHLAEKILTSRAAMEGERKQVTVLFADMKGSMELLADRDPEEARALLDPVLERMMEGVHRYEGTVNQVMGDGIMALFGAPLAHEDHAVRACFAALRMQEAVKRYAEEVQRRAGVAINIRVGLNAGEVVVRSIGSDLHMDYTAVGQTTHLAARMEQTAQPGSILLTGDVLRLAEGYVQTKPLGPIQVKGLATPVAAYELTGAGPVRSRLQLSAARGLTRFVGRDKELGALHAALEQARGGRGQLAAVTGDPGVGKSRLAWELVHGSARTDGCLTLQAAAVSYGKSTPYLPVLDLLRQYFQLEERDDAWKIRAKITRRIVDRHRPLEAAIPAFLALFDVPVEDPDWQTLDPPQKRWRTLDALRRLLLLESALQPVLVIVENLHWIDSETQAFLDDLVEALPIARLFLLVTYRPEYPDPWQGRPGYRPIRLEPLPGDAVAEMLDALVGRDPSVAALKEMLARQTQGNPLFLEETIATLAETGALAGERGAYRLARAYQTVQVPSTVHAVLAARIDRLTPDEKALLQSASVIGAEVPFSLLYAVADLPEDTLRRHLMSLEAADFVREAELFPDLAYALKHVLTQEVAYASLLHERRRGLHARVVEALEAQAPDRVLEQIERLAHHALRGEEWAKAVRYCRQAGMKAAARSANREALDCFQQALAALRRLPASRERTEAEIDLRLDLRPALLQLGRLDELLEVSREAEAQAQELGDETRLGRVYSWLTNYHYLKGELATALDYGERCLAIADRLEDAALRSLAERYMGHISHAQGDGRRADEILRANIQRLERVGERDTAATIAYVDATAWRAWALADLGEFEQAYAHLDRAQHAAETSRHAYSQAIACTLSGLVFARQGLLERAVAPLERALALCEEKTLAVWQPIPSSVLGLTRVLLGEADAGLRLLEDGVNLSHELGVAAYLALWTAHLAEGQLVAGHLDPARASATRALELSVRYGERGHQAAALRVLGEVAARRPTPDRESAEVYYTEALTLALDLGLRPLAAHVQLSLGRLLERAGDRARAEEQITAATATFWQTDMRRWLKQAELELARLGQLFIVGRHNPGLYEYLSREFADHQTIRVILDRRSGDRQMLTALGVAVGRP